MRFLGIALNIAKSRSIIVLFWNYTRKNDNFLSEKSTVSVNNYHDIDIVNTKYPNQLQSSSSAGVRRLPLLSSQPAPQLFQNSRRTPVFQLQKAGLICKSLQIVRVGIPKDQQSGKLRMFLPVGFHITAPGHLCRGKASLRRDCPQRSDNAVGIPVHMSGKSCSAVLFCQIQNLVYPHKGGDQQQVFFQPQQLILFIQDTLLPKNFQACSLRGAYAP